MVGRQVVVFGLAALAVTLCCAWGPAGSAPAAAQPAGKTASQGTSQGGWVSRITGILSGQPGSGPVTQREADQGLREALSFATVAAADRLGAPGGFLDSPKVRIPLPGALARAQARLRPFGMSGPLDEVEVSLNRAAEAAMPEARTLVLAAVRSITLGDALAIVRGGDNAATTFLRQRTEASISKALRPHLAAALDKTGAFAALDQAAKAPAMQAMLGDVRKDVTDFALQKAIDGLFQTLAEEERAIRTDPARRTTAILKRVFGVGSS